MLKRKDRILISALELLEESGINGVTTKNLARKEGVSEPALYRQYKSKLHIIESIIEEYAGYDDKIMNTILESGMKGKKALHFYVRRYCELYQSYSEITTVMLSMDVFFYNEDTKARMKEIAETKRQFLKSIIEEAQYSEAMEDRFTPMQLAEMIDGLLISQVYYWRMAGKDYSLWDRILPMINQLLGQNQ